MTAWSISMCLVRFGSKPLYDGGMRERSVNGAGGEPNAFAAGPSGSWV
jgi:hypothetical protein